MAVKHAPGPWGSKHHLWNVVDSAGDAVALVTERAFDETTAKRAGDFSRPERLANARLIAAAPELLEAAKAGMKTVFDYWFDRHAKSGETEPPRKGWPEYWALKAAIEKAVGR